MINKLIISNFESYKDTVFEFCSGVNAIIGPTDSGKSGVLRALKWPIKNRPSGNSFAPKYVKSKKKETTVGIGLENVTIYRSKGKENLYTIVPNDTSQKEIVFKAFGTSVPEKIYSLFNIFDVNIQGQFDPPFFLSLSPGEVARQLNKAVNLDVIDRSQRNIGLALKKENNLLKHEKRTITQKQEELKQYQWLNEVHPLINSLEDVDKQVVTLKESANVLSEVMKLINNNKDQIQKINSILIHERSIEDLYLLNNKIDKQVSLYNNLNEVLNDIYATKKQKAQSFKLFNAEKQLRKLIDINTNINLFTDQKTELFTIIKDIRNIDRQKAQSFKLFNAEKPLRKLIDINTNINLFTDQKTELFVIIKNIKGADQQLITQAQTIKDTQNEFNEQMSDICPLCNQEIKK